MNKSRRTWILGLAVLVGLAAHVLPAMAEAAVTWEPGMYWTYDATTSWVQTDSGKITLVVLGKATPFFSDVWVLAAIRDWWSGGEIVIPVWVLEPRAGYLRWPVLANLLPKAESVTLYSALTYRAALLPLVSANTPFRIETVGHASNAFLPPEIVMHPDWLDEEFDPWEAGEALTLIPRDAAELALPSGSFSDALPVQYEWTNSGDSNSGVAWWLPELLAWGYTAGREQLYGIATPSRTYAITLTEWGSMSEAELTDRLRLALEKMEPFEPEQTEDFRMLLDQLGLGLGQ